MLVETDLTLMNFMTSFAGKSPLFDHALSLVTRLDIFKGVPLICLFWFTWFEVRPNEPQTKIDKRREQLIVILFGTIISGCISRALQLALSLHKRPALSDLHMTFPGDHSWMLTANPWNSFPSDHAMLFAALCYGLWTVNRNVGLIAFVWTLLIIDIPRIFLGMHFPSDIIGGTIFGMICMAGILALPHDRLRVRIYEWKKSHQGLFVMAAFFVTDAIAHMLFDLRQIATSLSHIGLYW
jgi:undecaprenyl-diphosphatase